MASAANASHNPDAFRLLYPDEFFSKFYAAGVRPDGRPLGRARQTSINLGAAASADGSSLVKIGRTTMLAGIKLEVAKPTPESPHEGFLDVEFHMPPLCSPFNRPGRLPESAHGVAEQLSNALQSSSLLDRKELCIKEEKAVWVARLDVYCLDADGALLDAALLASVAALANLRFPAIKMDENDRVTIDEENSGSGERNKKKTAEDAHFQAGKRLEGLTLGNMPICLTCGLYKSYLLADPSAEEESLCESSVSVILDAELQLVNAYKPGGRQSMNVAKIQDCIAATQLRCREVRQLLKDVAIVST